MKTRIIVLFAILPAAGLAQSPPDKRNGPAPVPDLVRKYDFGAQVDELQNEPVPPAGIVKPQFASQPGQPRVPPVPKDFHPKDVHLDASQREALKVSEHWRSEGTQPAAGADGRVLYSFGSGLATVVCAPLRICIIELQAGEKITGEPQIGDSLRRAVSRVASAPPPHRSGRPFPHRSDSRSAHSGKLW